MAGSSKAPFLLPANFVDNPTEAPFPRRLIVYDGASDAWDATDDKDIIVKTKYLFVSYRNSDFAADADRLKLELNVQTVCDALQLPAYWLDYACTGSTQEEKNVDLYRIADVVRNAAKTLIVIKGGDESPHSPGWHSWGDRLWTLPEALLSGYGGDRLLYKAGTKPHKSVTLRDVANHAYKDGDKEMSLMNNYRGEPVIQSDIFLESLIKAIWKRTSGPVKGKEKAGALTAYEAERVYALMGFMPKRIIPDPNESEEEAFGRLMKENRLNKDLKTILNSSEKDIPVNVPTMSSMDPEHRRVLDKIPYTEGMRYDSGKCCLADTRVDILEDIKNCIDNKDGAYNEKRIFLLTGVAGSGKSTIAHSIASHYYKEGQLGSSFFFSVSNREKSQPKNLLRTIAKDIAEKYLAVRENLYAVLKDNSSLCTTESIQDQYDIFIQDPTKGDVLKDTVVVVIDALDECEQSGDARTTLLRIIAKKMSAISSNLRVFLTARAGDAEVLRILNSAQCTQIFTMNKDSHSRSSDIQTFFLHKFSSYSEKFPGDWLGDLIRMSGNLFIWASTACSYILNENDVRSPTEKLKIILSLKKDSKEEADLDSPDRYLYKLYTEVLKNAFNIPNLSKESLKTTAERYTTVMGVVLVAYTSLSRGDIDELLGSKFDSERVISRMGSLLDGTTHLESPVQLLHASFGDFLRTKHLSGDFHIDIGYQHGRMVKNCLELMNRSLKFNIFNLKDVSVPERYFVKRHALRLEEMRTQISKALQYSCRYWLTHILQMSKDDFGLIEEPLRRFLITDKHLMHWIEVISVMEEVDAARDALLSLYHWLNEIICFHDWISQLIVECYHLLRCFEEAIASGPLQVYVSALPYLPPESQETLYALYKEQAKWSSKVLFGRIKEIRLFSSKLDLFSNHECALAIAFSNDGTQIAFLFNTILEIWDFATLSRISDSIALKDSYYGRNSVVFSPDGCKIAILGSRSIQIWDLIERRLLISQTNNHGEAISFPDNDHLFCCRIQSNSLEVSEWTILEERTLTYTLETGSSVTCVALSSNAKHLGSILETSVVMVWARNVTSKFNLRGREEYRVLAISNDEEHVACGSREGTVKLWNFQTGSLVWTGKTDGAIEQMLMPLSLDNKQMVTVSKYGYVHVWDMASGSCYEHESRADIAALSPDGRHLVTSSKSGSRVWAVEANKDEAALLPREKLLEVVFLTDGSLFAWGRGVKEGDVVVLDKLGTANASRQTLEGHASWIKELRFSSDGKRLCSWDGLDNIILWSRDGDDVRFSVRETLKFDREEAHLMDAVPSTNGRILVAGKKEKNVVVWDNFGSQNEQKQVLRCEEDIWDFRLTSDGRGLVSHDDEDNVFLWCRGNDDVRFELIEKRACSAHFKCEECFKQLAYWQTEDTPEDSQSPASQTQADGSKYNPGEELKRGPFLTFDAKWRWVGLVNGRRLWYIPEGFLGYDFGRGSSEFGSYKFAQKGRKIVVYGPRFAILFECEDEFFAYIIGIGSSTLFESQ